MALAPFVTGAAYATVTLAFPCVTDDAVGALVTVVPLASALAVPSPALLLARTCTVAYVVSSVRPEMRNEVAVSNEAATHADPLSSRYSYPVIVAAPVGAVKVSVGGDADGGSGLVSALSDGGSVGIVAAGAALSTAEHSQVRLASVGDGVDLSKAASLTVSASGPARVKAKS